jgi:hypothetical protein
MCFADARGIPVVDEEGKPLSLEEAKEGITIPYLHDLIATEVPRDQGDKKLLRSLIQDENGTAFNNIDDYNGGIINKDYPRYGIDANRDIRKSLESTQVFDAFISSLTTVTRPENIKVIMVHGYYPNGAVFGTYTVDDQGKVDMVPEGEDFAKMIHGALFTSEFKKFYDDTQREPLRYAGEWNQVLYREHGKIISVDIELPKELFDEGRRNEQSINRYDSAKVKETFDGVLVPGKDSFQSVLEKILKEM